MNQIAGLGISTQRGTFITWNKYVQCVQVKMNARCKSVLVCPINLSTLQNK